VAKRLKHVWSNTDQTMDTSRWASVVRMRAPNMFDTAVQTNKTSPIKHENKRNVLSCLIECLMAFKFFQTRSNSTKQGGQTVKCLVTKHCLMVFGRDTFLVWTSLYIKTVYCRLELCLSILESHLFNGLKRGWRRKNGHVSVILPPSWIFLV